MSHPPPESAPSKISAGRTWPQKSGTRSRASARPAERAREQLASRISSKYHCIWICQTPLSLPPDDEIDLLTRLAIKHGTDKWGLHFYTPVYNSFLRRMRRLPIRLLEIGIGGYNMQSVGGASLAMWADYFPEGRIVGIDVADKRLRARSAHRGAPGSQEDADFLNRVCDELVRSISSSTTAVTSRSTSRRASTSCFRGCATAATT